MADNRQYAALEWVLNEIKSTLTQAAKALESYSEDNQDITQLRFCLTYVQQVYGALHMLGFDNVATLAKEMESLADAFIQQDVASKEEAQEVLMHAILQLPNYLEQLQQTRQENPTIVLTLINGLRAARGASLLDEGSFFAPNLDYAYQIGDQKPAITQDDKKFKSVVEKTRQMYQQATANIVSQSNTDENLEYLSKACKHLQKVTENTYQFALWEATAALVEGLQHGVITLTPVIESLFDQLGRELEDLIQYGVVILDKQTDKRLLTQLIDCVISAQGETRLIKSIRRNYGSDATNQPALQLIDNAALSSVGIAIKDEFRSIKNILDHCLEREDPKPDLITIENILTQISDTLRVSGFGDLQEKDSVQEKIASQISTLVALQQQDASVTNEQLLNIAHNVVDIEDVLNNALPGNQSQHFATQSGNYRFDKAQVSVLRESRNSLEKVKEAITDYSTTQWDIEYIKATPALLRETCGGLFMLPLERPAQVLDACADYIEYQLINAAVEPECHQLDSLADAIVSVDYYLDYTLSSFSDDNEFLLAVAEKSMASLGYPIAVSAPKPVDMTIDAKESETAAASSSIPTDASATPAKNDEEQLIPQTSEATQKPEVEQASITEKTDAVDDEDGLDDEIIEIFIEEAGEVLENIAEFLPQWAANFNDTDALKEVRRAFHTLKGSGRMVGANEIGELAWSIENMLNRVIDDTIPASDAIVILLHKVCDILGGMIKAFKDHRPAPQPQLVEQYMAWGQQIASGDSVDISEDEADISAVTVTDTEADAPITVSVENTAEDNSTSVEVDDSETVVVDSQLLEIFISESNNHLEIIKHYISEVEASMPIFQLPSDLMQRALHTLKGSAFMTEILPIANLMAAMESFVKELRSYQVDINADFLQLIKDCVSYIEEALIQLADKSMPDASQSQPLIVRVAELRELMVGPIIHQQEQTSESKQADPRLLEQFMATEMDLLIETDSIIDNWTCEKDQTSDWQAIAGELETLSLAAKQANLPPMNRLSEALLYCYRQLMSGAMKSSDHCYRLLREAHAILLTMVDAVAAGQNIPEVEEALLTRLQSAHSDTESNDIELSTISDEPTIPDSRTTSYLDVELDDNNIASPADSAADSHTQTDDQVDNNEQVGNDEKVDSNEDIDTEVVEIFLDEANELLEEIDETIHKWENDSSDTSNNSSLQRSLHTLKGGARMSGLISLGDLAHDFETFLIDNKDNSLTRDFFADIQKFQDQLHHTVSSVISSGSAAPDGSVTVSSDTQNSHDAQQSTSDTIAQEQDLTNNVSSPEEPAVIEPTKIETTNDSGTTQSTTARVLPFTVKNNASPTVAPAFKPAPVVEEPIKPKKANTVQELLKVPADLMEDLVNLAGETSISRGRMEEQVSEIAISLDDMDMTVQRLQEQIRRLDIETEAQVLFRQEQMAVETGEFDPLEMDRYTQLQQLTRSLIESASDLMDLKLTLINKIRDTETILLQQSRINTDLQEGLMRSRMVPFSSKVPRLRRIVRQVSSELNKSVNFEFDNVEGELDRSILEKMVTPLEHMLRNAVGHGIEDADTRKKLGKPAEGRIVLSLNREGGDIVLRLSDDGGGINVEKVRQKAIERQLMNADAQLNDQDILQFILHAGFSTADTVTQIAGRGVGMDVVDSEIKQVGGNLSIHSTLDEGTTFTIRLPFTVSVNRALLVVIGDDLYAVPLNTIEGIVLIKTEALKNYYSNAGTPFEYAGNNYQVRYLATIMNMQATPKLEEEGLSVPVLLVHSGNHRVALQVDQLQSSREIVVKSLGVQFNSVQGLSGVTIMGDGDVVVILDLHALIRRDVISDQSASTVLEASVEELPSDRRLLVMVVDDSVTVRKVTTRLLEREGFDVVTAKDGVEAMNLLQDDMPDAMLLDIEMPRMDGFEVARNVRSSNRLKHLPIIMITSRTGEKHRQRGLDLGVNIYMGKPYQEEQLLDNIREVTQTSSHIQH